MFKLIAREKCLCVCVKAFVVTNSPVMLAEEKGHLRSRFERSGGSFHSAPRHPLGSQEDC